MIDLRAACELQWKLNDNLSTTVVLDSSGNSRHGNWQNEMSEDEYTINSSTPSSMIRNLKFGSSGDGSYAYIATPIVLTSDWSMSIFIKPAHFRAEICQDGSNVSKIIIANSMDVDVYVGNDSATAQPLNPFTTGEWQHLVVVSKYWSPGFNKVSIYRNAVVPDPVEAGLVRDNDFEVQSLGWASGLMYDGEFDNFMLFNRALTYAEIVFLYNGGLGTEYLTSSFTSKYIKFGYLGDVHFSEIPDALWHRGGTLQNEFRRYSTANNRFGEFKDTVNAENPACSFAIHAGDPVSQYGAGDQILTQLGLFNTAAGLLTPDFYNIVGNHDWAIVHFYEYITWAQYFATLTNHGARDNKFPDNDNPKAYTFTKDGFLCIVLDNSGSYIEGVEGDDQLGWLEAILDTNAAGNELPILVFCHTYLHTQMHAYGLTGYASFAGNDEPGHLGTTRTLLENSGLVQGVFQGHYHRAKSNIVINDIPYFSMPCSVLAPLVDDNAYFIVEVQTNKVRGANQWMSAINVKGYGNKSITYDRSKFGAFIA